MKRRCAAVLPALLVSMFFTSLAWGQSISFTGSGSGSDSSGSGPSGNGTLTLTPGGAATFTFTGKDTGDDNCSDSLQLTISWTLPNGDSLTVFFNATDFSQSGNTMTVKGTTYVTAGKGAWANTGGTGDLTIVATNGSNSTFTFTTTGSITLGGPLVPRATVDPSGIAAVYSKRALISPGAWVSVFGTNLANTTATWNGDFPLSLGGVTATVDNKAAYLWFVSAGQINMQVPDSTKTGCVPVVVNTPNGSVTVSVEQQGASPSLSLLDDRYVAAVILTPNGSGAYGNGSYDLAGPKGRFAYTTRPAKRGENVVLYGVGFGPTNPAVPAGKIFNGSARTVQNIFVALGTQPNGNNFVGAPVSFAGLVAAGLYQINITIPNNAPTGDAVVSAGIPNGPAANSLPVYIPIQ